MACLAWTGATEWMRPASRSASASRSVVLVFVAECQQFEQRVERQFQQWQREQQQ
jgi:hypothetical protein